MCPEGRRIGIYWVHQGRVFGKTCLITEADTGVPGLLDSPFTHVDAWATVKAEGRLPMHLDYDDLPRGRVLYLRDRNKWLVYGDGAVLGCSAKQGLKPEGEEIRQAIARHFGFELDSAVWRHDPHYTVGRHRIVRLLDD